MKKLLRRTGYTLLICGALYLAAIAFLAWYPNFYTVIPQQVYRSSQLSSSQFDDYINRYHIKSIINLRGSSPDADWYQHEIAVSQKNNVTHYDLHLDAFNENSPEDLRTLVTLIQDSPKPVLIHCWHGADRTGLASAMSIILLKDGSLSEAEQQVSFRYLAIDPRTTGRVELAAYKQWLNAHQLQHNQRNFLAWIDSLNAS